MAKTSSTRKGAQAAARADTSRNRLLGATTLSEGTMFARMMRPRRWLTMSAVMVAAAAGNFAVAPAWAQTSIAGGTIAGTGSISGSASGGVLISGQNGDAGPDTLTGLTVANTSGATTADAVKVTSGGGNTAAEANLAGVNSLSTSVSGGAAIELVVTNTGNASLGDSGGNSLTGSYGVLAHSPGNIWMVLTDGTSGDTITANGTAVAGILQSASSSANLTLGSTTISGFATGVSMTATNGPVIVSSTSGSTISGFTDNGIFAISGATAGQGVSVSSASALTGDSGAIGINAASSGGGNSVTTLAGGTIDGGATGISVGGAIGTNATTITVGAAIGDITAPTSYGVSANGSSTATNTINVNADVRGGQAGIQIGSGNFTTTVASGVTVASATGSGIVDIGTNDTLTVNNQGTISGFRAIDTGATSNLIANNSGTLTGSAQAINGNAITLVNSGTITSGTSNTNIVTVLANSVNVVNTGTISSANAQGIYANGVGQIVNGATGTITNTSANGRTSIYLGGGGSVDNYGSIAQGVGAGGSLTLTLEAGSNTGGVGLSDAGNTVNVYTGTGASAAAVVDSGSGLTLRAAGPSAAAAFGSLSLGAGANTLNLLGAGDGTAANGAAGSLDLSQVSGASTLAKADTGTWTLTGDATNSGVTAINAGNGSPSGVLVFNGSGLSADIYVNGAQVIANSAAALGTGTIHAIDPLITFAGTGTYTNNISLETTSAIDPTVLQTTTGVTATLSGAITTGSGAGVLANQAVTIDGPGVVVLTNTANNWSGVTTINSGSTLQGTSATISGGSIVDNGTLAYVQGANGTVNQAISGAGSVVVGVGSNVTLAGAGTWTGATTVDFNGALTGTTESIGGSSIVDNGTLAYVQANSGTVAQNISGTGALTVSGLASGQTLTFGGALTQMGGFTITDGSNVTLASGASFTGGGTIATGSGTLTNLGLVTNDGNTGNAIIANAGGTIVNGAAGNSSATIVGAAYGVYATGAGEVVNNYGLIAAGVYSAGVTTFGGNGAGVYLQNGGTVTNNVGAVIGGGEFGVEIGQNGMASTGSFVLNNMGQINGAGGFGVGINFGPGGSITNSGTISGGFDGLAIESGTVQVTNTGSITGLATGGNGIAVGNAINAVIANSGTISTPAVAGSQGWGVVFEAAGLLVNTGTIGGDEGVEVGAGGVKVINGATGVINGATYGVETVDGNTPTGATLVNYGQITGGGLSILGTGTNAVSLMAGSSTAGSITFGTGDNTLALYTGAVVGQPVVDATTGLTVQGAGTYGAASFGAIAFGAGTNAINLLGAGDGSAANGVAGALNLANVTGATILNKGDTGTWALTGDANGAGVATINAGNGSPSGLLTFDTTGLTAAINVNGAKIQALTAGAFGTGVITAIDPTLEYSATGAYANPIILASTSASDPTRLEADPGITATLTGAITSGSGNGALAAQPVVFDGGGTVVLTNAGNSWSGSTTIASGSTLALAGAGAIAGSSSVADNGTFDISGSTVGGATVASLSGSGAVSLGANTLTLASASDTFSGAIGGTGGLTVGGGTETLGGANTYTGATTINAGASLALTGAGSIASSSGVADNGTFDVSNATAGVTVASLSGSGVATLGANTLTLASASGTFSGAIGGTGGLTIASGTETLGGANTYTGATTINTGATLALAGAGSIAGSGVVDNGTFDVSGATAGATVANLSGSGAVSLGANTLSVGSNGADATFSGAIGGSGGLTKVGAGELLLTGDSTYTGATLVQAGILSVNGSIGNSAVTVASGATLTGVGQVGSLTVNGVVAPGGGSIGTLTVQGDLNLGSTSVYQAVINQAGQSDVIAVSGDAHLGGTLQVAAAPGAYVRRTTYQLITGPNIIGAFSSITGNLPFVDPTVVTTGNGANLLWQNNGVAFQSLAVTPNQRAAAAAIFQAPSSALYSAISTQTTAGARQAFDAISGEIYADAPAELVQESHLVRDALLQRLRDGASPAAVQAGSYGGAADVTAWVQGIGDFARSAAEQGGDIASTQADTAGAMLGVDARVPNSNNWRVGVATAYTDTTLNDEGRNSRQTIDTTHFAAYAGGTVIGDLQARLGFDYAWTRLDTHRQVAFPGVNETDHASPDAQVADLFVETGYVFRFGRLRVEPFANGAYVHAAVDSAQETGGIATLNLGKDALDAALTEAGVRMSASWRLTPSAALEPYLSLSERHAFGDDGSSALLSFTGGGSSFLTHGVGLDRDAGNVEFGGVFDLGERVRVDAAYSSQMSSHWQDQTLKLTASYRF